jgi:hypothetical protein
MLPPRLLSAFLALFVYALVSAGNAPVPERSLPAGEWNVEFTNGVIETCEIRKDGTASESEPNRKSDGKAVDKDGKTVVAFDDDRTERPPSPCAWSSCTGIPRPNSRGASRCAASQTAYSSRFPVKLPRLILVVAPFATVHSNEQSAEADCSRALRRRP